VSKDPKLGTILHAPTLTAADKSQIIAELEKAAGVPSSDKTVKNLLQTLAENNRLSLLGGVCAKFGEIMSASRGEVEMVVTSATVCCLSRFACRRSTCWAKDTRERL
jgi:F-type H+-transporting ATPase subunit O